MIHSQPLCKHTTMSDMQFISILLIEIKLIDYTFVNSTVKIEHLLI